MRLGKLFQEANRIEVDQKVSDVFLQNGVEVSVRVQRTYTILLLFALQVISVLEIHITVVMASDSDYASFSSFLSVLGQVHPPKRYGSISPMKCCQ